MTASTSILEEAPKTLWGRIDGQIRPYVRDEEGRIHVLTWAPMPGSQKSFMECSVQEVCYAGTRGPGKTDALLMSFAQHIGKWGKDWRGIIFRRTYPELEDIIGKADKWFSEIFPEATYNKGKHFWEWPTGERLYFGHMRVPSDYNKYHGHNYPFIGWEELTTWPSKDCFVVMLSTNRTTNPNVPKMIRATTNPHGCVPYGEVLTDRGWVDIAEVAAGDTVLSVDAYGQQVWKPVSDVIRQYWEGDMISRQGRGMHMVFTSDHRLPHLNTSRTEHSVKSFEDLPGDASIRRTGLPVERLREEDRFAPDAAFNSEGQQSPVTSLTAYQYASVLGWMLAEGSTCPRERAFCIAQTKPHTVQMIRDLLNDCGFKFRYDGQQFWVYEGSWMKEFEKYGKCRDKYIPRRIFDCGTGPLTALFESLMLGDGCGQTYYTTSRKLADDVAELCTRLGYATYVSFRQREDRKGLSWSVSFSERAATKLITGNHLYDVSSRHGGVNCTREKFSGEVYCLTVPDTETFFLRQKGCVWLSGNSGHNWVKARYKLPVKAVNESGQKNYFGELCGGEQMVDEKGKPILDGMGRPMYQPERIAIHGDIDENFLLLDADPGYKATIAASASSPSQLKAWLHGSWDVVAGGMFDDLWDSQIHIVEPFKIPPSWRIDRSFDWGSSKPASVGWWAESDGTDYINAAGFRIPTVKGDIFRIHEWYMCKKGEENKGLMLTDREIAAGVKDMQLQHPTLMGKTVHPGPADTSIFDTTNGQSIAKAMADMGVRWTRADKSSGSRILGWQRIRNRLQASIKKDGLPRENPGLYVFDTCEAFIRTVPVLPRDERNTEDCDTEAEDHIADEMRYRLYSRTGKMVNKKIRGR